MPQAVGTCGGLRGAAMNAIDLVTKLRLCRYTLGTEVHLQQSVAENLRHLVGEIQFKAEAKIGPRERIDFLVAGSIGIECKLKYNRRQIFRQLQRYQGCDGITALILITNTAMGLPKDINGTPLYYVSLGRSFL